MTNCDCNELDKLMFKCMDCGMCTNCAYEYYMVHDSVWNKVAKRGMLCIGCLEARCGRLLTKDDFTDAPINTIWGHHGSARLKSRLTGEAKAASV